MSVTTDRRSAWCRALGTLVLLTGSAMLALPATPAHAADTGSCSGEITATFPTHGGKHEYLFKNEPKNIGINVGGQGNCTSTDPTINGVIGSGTATVNGTCLNFDVTFAGRLDWIGPNGGAGYTLGEGSGTGVTTGDDIVVTLNVAKATGGSKFANGIGIGLTLRFVGAGLTCINDGKVGSGSGSASGDGAA